MQPFRGWRKQLLNKEQSHTDPDEIPFSPKAPSCLQLGADLGVKNNENRSSTKQDFPLMYIFSKELLRGFPSWI